MAKKKSQAVRWNRLLPWWAASALAAVATALVGWLVCAAFFLLGWLPASDSPIETPLELATQLWVLSNGGGALLDGVPLTLVPLGLTLVILACGSGLAGAGTLHSFNELPDEDSRDIALWRIVAVFSGVYMALVLLSGYSMHSPLLWRAGLVSLLLGFVMSLWGAGKALGWRLRLELVKLEWPRWLDALPAALGAGFAVMLACSSLVLILAIGLERERIIALSESFGADGMGQVLLLVVQLAWLPNFTGWTMSWLTGAGISFGVDALASPVANYVGLLPGLPIFGAAPTNGVESGWMLAWLICPVVAGAVSGWIMLRSFRDDQLSRRELAWSRPDLTAIIGGATGVLTGLFCTGLAALTGGDLGSGRLVSLGPVLGTMAVMAPTLMGLSGMVYGALSTVFRYEWKIGKKVKTAAESAQPTVAEEPTVEPGSVTEPVAAPVVEVSAEDDK